MPPEAKVESKPVVADSKPSKGDFLPDSLPEARINAIREGREKEDAVVVDNPEVKPSEESQTTSEPVKADLGEVLKLEGGKEIAVDEVVKSHKFVVPVGDDEHELTYDELKAHAGRGIMSAKLNQQAKETKAEALKVIKETQQLVEEVRQEHESKLKEEVQNQLNDYLDQVLKNIDPSSGKKFGSEQERGDAETLLRGMDKVHKAGRQTEKPPVDVKKEVQEALKAERERLAQESRVSTAKSIWDKSTEPHMHKFLKADGKTLNKTAFNLFKNSVAERAGELAEGQTLNEESGKQLMAKAIEEVLPLFKTTEAKTTTVVEKREPVPTVKPSGGSVPTIGKEATGKKFSSQEDYWESRFGGK